MTEQAKTVTGTRARRGAILGTHNGTPHNGRSVISSAASKASKASAADNANKENYCEASPPRPALQLSPHCRSPPPSLPPPASPIARQQASSAAAPAACALEQQQVIIVSRCSSLCCILRRGTPARFARPPASAKCNCSQADELRDLQMELELCIRERGYWRCAAARASAVATAAAGAAAEREYDLCRRLGMACAAGNQARSAPAPAAKLMLRVVEDDDGRWWWLHHTAYQLLCCCSRHH